jgi:xanthine dehydrogenase/oxidase
MSFDDEMIQKEISLREFLNTNMHKKLITRIHIPAYDPSKFIFRSYKIMPRAQNAHAYVNAAFLLQFNDDKKMIEKANVCFGGINSSFVHAANLEKFLIQKNIFDNQILRAALKVLYDEVNPDFIPPDASAEYRKNLAVALFYKFVVNIAPENKVQSFYKSGGKILKRELSSGLQTFDTYEKYWPLTKKMPKIEGEHQCTGEAKYVNDFPILPDELHAAFVTAKNVHGIIEKIDASNALLKPGVVAFFSAKDIVGKNTFMPENYMFVVEPEEIFCSSKVLFFNQPIGIIVAQSFKVANEAANLVKVVYVDDTKEQSIKTSIRDVKNDPLRTHVYQEYCKDSDAETTDKFTHSINGTFEMGGQYHFSLETQTSLCIPIEDGIDVYSSTQWMDLTQIAIAEMLNIRINSINMNVRRLGGAFGAKISRASQIACATALASHKLNKPVRFVMSLEANMNIVGKRYPCMNEYQVKTDDNGKILRLHNDYVEDYGCSFNEPAYLTTEFFDNCYDGSAFDVVARKAKTDTSSNTWCRGPGTLEGVSMIENIMEHIARKVNKDPVDVRMSNIPANSEIKNILQEFIRSVDYRKRKDDINDFNDKNRWIKRGIAIVPLKFHIEYFGSLHALVSIYHRDGSVSITVGGISMGQGLNTKVAQTAAHILGINIDKISIKSSNSLTSPNDTVTGASIGSEISCFAVKKACEILNARLRPIRDINSRVEWSQLVEKAFEKDVDLSASYMYKSADVKEYNVYGASCCEVEVDILTGNLLIKRVDITEDVGESMNPGIDIGQIEGAFVMGLGYFLTEKLVHNEETGELLTNRTWNYKIPGAKDIPIDFRINFLRNSSNPFGVLRSKG